MAEPFPLQPALWTATATPAPPVSPLTASVSAHVCVVGGGYAGLSTALHLAERGVKVVVLEAREIGFGGSGRNGGQVIPGLKYDPDELEEMFGPERGKQLVAFAGGTADVVFELIARHRMDVPHTRSGWIQGAHSAEMAGMIESRVRQWQQRGVAAQWLDRSETARAVGNDQYLSAWIDPRGGGVQPLSFTYGLAKAALAAGATIHRDTPATRLVRAGAKWNVETRAGHSVTADRIVIATNGYTGDLWPRLRQTVIATNSFLVATEPLSDNVRKSILPGGQMFSDGRRLVFYIRFDHTGRLLFGGRGPFREPKGAADWDHLALMMERMFPQVKGARIDYRWCGRVAITRDFMPHLHEPEPGLLIDIGCMGRGVALQTAMGRAMAQYIASGDASALPLPLTPIQPIPIHRLSKAYTAATIAWYRFLDRRGMSAAV